MSKSSKLGIGLIGCGAIGSALARAVDEGKAGDVRLLAAYDLFTDKTEVLCSQLASRPKVARSFEELVATKGVNLIVEASSQAAVREYAVPVVESGKELMLMSTGALVDVELHRRMKTALEKTGRMVYLPSGAIAGLDGVKAANIGRIDEVTLTSTKPPQGLKGTPYVEDVLKLDLEALTEATELYSGPAVEACRFFPKNVNVAASLSLAGIGPERTMVRIVADPRSDKNMHEIAVQGEFGRLHARVENVPSPDNPKTSYLAVLSAIATLKKIASKMKVGT
jgi:aspartate dehydrogenase